MQGPGDLLDCLLRTMAELGMRAPSLAAGRPYVHQGRESSVMQDMQAAVDGARRSFSLAPDAMPGFILVVLPKARSEPLWRVSSWHKLAPSRRLRMPCPATLSCWPKQGAGPCCG